jgi:hypothetical protein
LNINSIVPYIFLKKAGVYFKVQFKTLSFFLDLFFSHYCLFTIDIFVVALKSFVPKVPDWKITSCIHRIAAIGEWHLLYSVAKDKDGLLQRETVRGVFDASLFERLQANKKSSWWMGQDGSCPPQEDWQ